MATKRGPGRLKVEGEREDAVSRALRKPMPKAGWVKPVKKKAAKRRKRR